MSERHNVEMSKNGGRRIETSRSYRQCDNSCGVVKHRDSHKRESGCALMLPLNHLRGVLEIRVNAVTQT